MAARVSSGRVISGLRSARGLAALGCLVLALLATPALARQKASIVIDFATGEVLHADEPDTRAFPASLTKMMTLYLVFEAIEEGRLTPQTKLKISKHAAGMPPTKLGLKAGSSIKVEDAIMSLVTKSANDIASAVAENLGGSESRFAELMTAKARELGMRRTTFRNASGLPNAEQRSTARDMATLSTRLIVDFPQHYRYFARKSFKFGKQSLRNHNRLLSSYGGMDGIKTGYTNASGFNLAASAVRKGQRVVAVVLGGASAASRDAYMAKLLDRAFAQLEKRRTRPVPVPKAPEALVAALEAPARAIWIPMARPVTLAEAAVAEVVEEAGEALAAVAAAKSEIETAPAAVAAAAATAAPATVAAPAPAERPKSSVAYGVQVGVYSKSADAHRAARLALERSAVLRGTFVSVHSMKRRNRVLFRAQLLGLDRDDAQTACRQLKQHRQDCLVVQTGATTMASS